jgi:hypothetical protein
MALRFFLPWVDFTSSYMALAMSSTDGSVIGFS